MQSDARDCTAPTVPSPHPALRNDGDEEGHGRRVHSDIAGTEAASSWLALAHASGSVSRAKPPAEEVCVESIAGVPLQVQRFRFSFTLSCQ
ncbi:hypothetical protein AAFF_G00385750 [Aldrovandia affinis]|uniref:Uncharacterized protein n=1 Tax=Aldrovandia affinis TaxID=143900 RepID=A0AAD7SF79_9TELE|nr:hypothetical protein AAFF_G00385750 [Aldrovandia affinis]